MFFWFLKCPLRDALPSSQAQDLMHQEQGQGSQVFSHSSHALASPMFGHYVNSQNDFSIVCSSYLSA